MATVKPGNTKSRARLPTYQQPWKVSVNGDLNTTIGPCHFSSSHAHLATGCAPEYTRAELNPLIGEIHDDMKLRAYPNEKAETKKDVKAKYVVEALTQGLRVLVYERPAGMLGEGSWQDRVLKCDRSGMFLLLLKENIDVSTIRKPRVLNEHPSKPLIAKRRLNLVTSILVEDDALEWFSRVGVKHAMLRRESAMVILGGEPTRKETNENAKPPQAILEMLLDPVAHGAAVVRESVQVARYLEQDHEDAAARFLQACWRDRDLRGAVWSERQAYVDVCSIEAPSGFFSHSPPPRILAYMSDSSRFLVRIEDTDDAGLKTLEEYRGHLRDSCWHVLADTVQEGRSLRQLGKELPSILSTFGELASTPVYETEGIFGGSANNVGGALLSVSNAPIPLTNMNERARLNALTVDGGGSIARTFARAMEQMLDLEKVFGELAEKAPDALRSIRERHGAKPKPQVLDAVLSTDTKLPEPESLELLTNVDRKQRTRQMCTPAAMCAPDSRDDPDAPPCRVM
jgi:hypothetical protein